MTVIQGPWPGGPDIMPDLFSRHQGTPPAAEYLAMRERLGMASYTAVILHSCPWCGAGPAEACQVRATGKYLRQPHHARLEATP